MATPTREWVCLTILALLSSTLAMAHEVKPPKADLDHVVKPPKPDLNHVVKPPTPADLDHVVKPPKADPDHVVKPPKADLDHVVKPPKLPGRKLQMDKSGEDQSSQMDGTGAPASGCSGRRQTSQGWEEGEGGRAEGEGMYGGGQGSGGASFSFHNINPFPAFPFGAVVPEVSTWGGGGGYGGSNSDSGKDKDKGKGVQCHCSNGYTMHYTMSPINDPIHFPPMGIWNGDGPPPSPSGSP